MLIHEIQSVFRHSTTAKYTIQNIKDRYGKNKEVIVYRVMMYANPLLQLYRLCTSLPKVNLYITVLGGDF